MSTNKPDSDSFASMAELQDDFSEGLSERESAGFEQQLSEKLQQLAREAFDISSNIPLRSNFFV